MPLSLGTGPAEIHPSETPRGKSAPTAHGRKRSGRFRLREARKRPSQRSRCQLPTDTFFRRLNFRRGFPTESGSLGGCNMHDECLSDGCEESHVRTGRLDRALRVRMGMRVGRTAYRPGLPLALADTGRTGGVPAWQRRTAGRRGRGLAAADVLHRGVGAFGRLGQLAAPLDGVLHHDRRADV